jgi:hypothetical protein
MNYRSLVCWHAAKIYARHPGQASARHKRRITMKLLLVTAAFALCSVASAVEQTANTERSFTLGSGPRRLIVDNVWGLIEVTGADTSQVTMSIAERWRADTQAGLDRARRDVSLDLTQDGNTVRAFVNGPFRCNRNCISVDDDIDYVVQFDFRIRVPRDTAVELKTVNKGHVRVTGVTSGFDLRNVNGDIEATDVAGSGRAHTVNGPVRVSFRDNPREACSFKTVNGEISLSLQPNAAADFLMKTLNGEAWSDFEFTMVPTQPEVSRDGGGFVWRKNRMTAVRVGAGGPEIRIETLNGPIRLINRGKTK